MRSCTRRRNTAATRVDRVANLSTRLKLTSRARPPTPPGRTSAPSVGPPRAGTLGDDLGAVTGTSLDKGVELDALAKLPNDERSSAPFLLLPLCDASDRDASLGGAYRKHPTQIGSRRG